MSESTITVSTRPRLSGLAIASLLCAFPPFTLVTGPLAVYFGYRGLYLVNASDGRLIGRTAAIIGLLLGSVGTVVGAFGLFALIIANTRAADSRLQCSNNLRLIGLAVNQYQEDHEKVFPRAVASVNGLPPEERTSWLAAVLPYLELKPIRESKSQSLTGRLDLNKPWNDPTNREAQTTFILNYQCPGSPTYDPRTHSGLTQYVGISGVGEDAAALPKGDARAGFFGYERSLAPDDVRTKAGTSYKIMVLETNLHNGDWIAGGPATVRGVGFDPTFLNGEATAVVGMLASGNDHFAAPVGGVILVPRPDGPPLIGPGRPFGGLHADGTNILWADGSVRFVPETLAPHLLRMQASLSDDPAALADLP